MPCWSWCILLLICLLTPAWTAEYYIHPDGNDAADGLTPATAWQSMARVQNQGWEPGFQPGDQILFAAGHEFVGKIFFDPALSWGSAEEPIVIGSYGEGRATLRSAGEDGDDNVIIIWSNTATALGYEIRDLNLVGSGGLSHGLLVWNESPHDLAHLRVHNVHASGHGRDGIATGRAAGKGFLLDVRITACVAFDNPGTAGLSHPSGSGIVMGGTKGGLIEYCLAYNNGIANTNSAGPVGIWTWDSDGVIIQHCISHSNKTSGGDGGGFDIDGGCRNCIIQYCYSYNNYGSGYLFAQYDGAEAMYDNHIRYNLSVNDGRKGNYGGITIWGHNDTPGFNSGYIYHNVVYMSPPDSGVNVGLRAYHRYSGIRVFNNVFVLSGSVNRAVDSQRTSADDIFLLNNSYYRIGGDLRFIWGGVTYDSLAAWSQATGQEALDGALRGLDVDPRLRGVGDMPALVDPADLPQMQAYRLYPDSPLVDAALDLGLPIHGGIERGERDFYAIPLAASGPWAIGAHQWPEMAPPQRRVISIEQLEQVPWRMLPGPPDPQYEVQDQRQHFWPVHRAESQTLVPETAEDG